MPVSLRVGVTSKGLRDLRVYTAGKLGGLVHGAARRAATTNQESTSGGQGA